MIARIIFYLPIMLAMTLVSSCQKKDDEHAEAPRPVLSILAKETSADTLRLTGTVEPRVQTELGFRILGRITSRKVDVGDLVKQGDVVASIDPLALELAVKSSQSDLFNANAQLANAVTTEQRQRTLALARTGTEAALEEAEQALRTAQASVAKAQASLDKAQEQLSYAELHAEFDGVVTATSAELGQVVSAGQTVVTIARPEERDAVVDIPQFAAETLKMGAPFDVSLQLDPMMSVRGTVREIAPAADTATRTQRTKIRLEAPPSEFRLGSTVNVVAADASEPRIVLPSSAIVDTDGALSVWVVDVAGQKVVRRSIKADPASAQAATIAVSEGIEPGERIVVAGVYKLKDGQAIRIDQEVRP